MTTLKEKSKRAWNRAIINALADVPKEEIRVIIRGKALGNLARHYGHLPYDTEAVVALARMSGLKGMELEFPEGPDRCIVFRSPGEVIEFYEYLLTQKEGEGEPILKCDMCETWHFLTQGLAILSEGVSADFLCEGCLYDNTVFDFVDQFCEIA